MLDSNLSCKTCRTRTASKRAKFQSARKNPHISSNQVIKNQVTSNQGVTALLY